MATLANALQDATARLAHGCDSARLDAELLLCHLLGRDRAYLRTWPERVLTDGEEAAYDALIARRVTGEPIAYITGRREFWSLELTVGPATLIPRPDTETLVELTLQRIPAGAAWTIADLGTGSGAIALAIARERPGCRIIATDASDGALAVARGNAARNGINNVEFRSGRWFAPLEREHLDLIVSNPPYVRSSDPHLGQGDVRFEPLNALTAGPDGLDDLRHLAAGAGRHLKAGGWLLLEHGWDQGAAVRELLTAAGLNAVATHQDAAGRDRVSVGRDSRT